MQTFIYQDILSIFTVPRERTMLLHGLYFRDQLMTTEWTDIVDFVEVFQAFNKNHLSTDQTYSICNAFEFELQKQNGKVVLSMYSSGQWVHFQKLEAAQISQKINRILARCDLLINME